MRPGKTVVGGNRVNIVVQKFGGTSVATAALRRHVVGHIRAAREAGDAVVAVVSAMGRAGDPYSTDSLLALLDAETKAGAEQPEQTDAERRDRDLLLACGEIISCVVLAAALRHEGIPAVALTGRDAGLITDDNFGEARILRADTTHIKAHLRAGHVAVVAGFQGVTADGRMTTLGRGGSDTTAAVLGAALAAKTIEIYKDVDGVFTADPRLAPEATMLDHMTYREIVELAHLGAKVVHPRAVEIAMEGNVPVRIRGTVGGGSGTLVTEGRRPTAGAADDEKHFDTGRVVTGIAHIAERVLFRLTPRADARRDDFALTLFQRLGEARISVDMIRVAPDQIGFIVAAADKARTAAVLEEFAVRYSATEGMAKVSVAGAGMHGVPGVMARVMRAFVAADAPVFDTVDSHANISCLVKEADVRAAVRALHDEFALSRREDHGREATVNEVG